MTLYCEVFGLFIVGSQNSKCRIPDGEQSWLLFAMLKFLESAMMYPVMFKMNVRI